MIPDWRVNKASSRVWGRRVHLFAFMFPIPVSSCREQIKRQQITAIILDNKTNVRSFCAHSLSIYFAGMDFAFGLLCCLWQVPRNRPSKQVRPCRPTSTARFRGDIRVRICIFARVLFSARCQIIVVSQTSPRQVLYHSYFHCSFQTRLLYNSLINLFAMNYRCLHCIVRNQPDSVANHVTARSIGDWCALTWLATAIGWARRKRSAICSGKLAYQCTVHMIPYDVNRRYGI